MGECLPMPMGSTLHWIDHVGMQRYTQHVWDSVKCCSLFLFGWNDSWGVYSQNPGERGKVGLKSPCLFIYIYIVLNFNPVPVNYYNLRNSLHFSYSSSPLKNIGNDIYLEEVVKIRYKRCRHLVHSLVFIKFLVSVRHWGYSERWGPCSWSLCSSLEEYTLNRHTLLAEDHCSEKNEAGPCERE